MNSDFSFPLFSIFVLLHRDFPVLILQGSFFASFPVVTSSKSGHQGELSPPSPRHRFILTSDLHSCSDSRQIEKILDPHRFNPFASNTERLGLCGCSCQSPTFSPFLGALELSRCSSRLFPWGRDTQDQDPSMGTLGLGYTNVLKSLVFALWLPPFQAGQGNGAPGPSQIPGYG